MEALMFTPAQNLARIFEILKPSVSELATLFCVSREQIKRWQSGEPPSAKNAEFLEDLARVSDMLVSEGITPSMHLWNRRINENQSLFDMVCKGKSEYEGGKLLIHILRMELEQRKQLHKRLANRPKILKDDNDFGIPLLKD